MALGDTLRTLSLAEAERLPLWRRPVALLALMAFAMPIAFATWSALLNNFVIEVRGSTGPISAGSTRYARSPGSSQSG
jgi:hypothetical protein